MDTEIRAYLACLVDEQNALKASSRDIASLRKSLRALTNLRHVHLDGFPYGAGDDAWTTAWGAKSLTRRIGLRDEWAVRAFVVDDYSNWRNIGEIIAGQGLMYGHYDRTLKALSGIADKDWTPEITLSSNQMWGEKAPIDLASPDWQAARKRVRVLNLATTSLRGRFFGGRPILEVFDQDWLKSFVNDCSDLESLTIGTDDNAGWLLRNFQFPKLRHLTIKEDTFLCQYLASFLKIHSGTLESITFKKVCFVLPPPPNALWLSYIYTEKPEDMLEDGEDVPRNPSWFSIFEIMLAMPQLQSVQLARLTQENGQDFQFPAGVESTTTGTTMLEGGAVRSFAATGDAIAQQLGCAITQKLTNVCYGYILNVWFPSSGEASASSEDGPEDDSDVNSEDGYGYGSWDSSDEEDFSGKSEDEFTDEVFLEDDFIEDDFVVPAPRSKSAK